MEDILEPSEGYDSDYDQGYDEEDLAEEDNEPVLSTFLSKDKQADPAGLVIDSLPFDDDDPNWEDISELSADESLSIVKVGQRNSMKNSKQSMISNASSSGSSEKKKDDVAVYGIFFDDQDTYDYTQHLKPIGEDPTAVYFSAPTFGDNMSNVRSKNATNAASSATGGIAFIVSCWCFPLLSFSINVASLYSKYRMRRLQTP